MRRVLFLIILLVLFSYSCKKRPTINNPQSLTIGVLPTTDYLPFAIASQNGTYDSLGLAVKFKVFYSEEEMCTAFHRQNIEGMLTDIPDAILQQNDYDDGQVIMQTEGYYQLIAKADIHSINNLKNKNVSISHNTAPDFLTGITLQKEKINHHVNEPEINKIPMRLTTLIDNRNDRISASFLPDVSAVSALRTGGMITLKNSIGLHLNVMMINNTAIDYKKKAIENLIIGYNIAGGYINSHPRKIWNKAMLYTYNIDKTTALHIKLPEYKNATLPSKRIIRLCRIWLNARHLLKASYNTKDLINSEFAKSNKNNNKKRFYL